METFLDFNFNIADLEIILLITFGSLSGAFTQYVLSPILLNGRWAEMTPERKRAQIWSGFISSYVAGLAVFAFSPEHNVATKLLIMVISGYAGVAGIEFIKSRLMK